MSAIPQPGENVPAKVRQELIDAIDAGKRFISRTVLVVALEYAQRHMGIAHPTPAWVWDYVRDKSATGFTLKYARLDDFPHQLGYAMRKVDGTRLYIKLRFDDDTNTIMMSFHG